MNAYDADLTKMLAMRQLYDLSTFDGPNGTETQKKKSLRIQICQHASALSGVHVAETDMEVPPLA